MPFQETKFTKEQIDEFHARSCEFRLGYEDCALLGIALYAEKDQILSYLSSHTDLDCDAARTRLRAIDGAIAAIKAGVMVTWPELHAEAEQHRTIAAVHVVGPDDEIDPADFARFSPVVGHG